MRTKTANAATGLRSIAAQNAVGSVNRPCRRRYGIHPCDTLRLRGRADGSGPAVPRTRPLSMDSTCPRIETKCQWAAPATFDPARLGRAQGRRCEWPSCARPLLPQIAVRRCYSIRSALAHSADNAARTSHEFRRSTRWGRADIDQARSRGVGRPDLGKMPPRVPMTGVIALAATMPPSPCARRYRWSCHPRWRASRRVVAATTSRGHLGCQAPPPFRACSETGKCRCRRSRRNRRLALDT